MKDLAVALCRVSTPEQKLNNSLNRQEQKCREAEAELGAEIAKWISGDISSKVGRNYDRPDLVEAFEFGRNNPQVKYLIVDEVDRFMRSTMEMGYWITKFDREAGMKVHFAANPELNNDDARSRLLLSLDGYKAEGSNEERQRKSINGHIQAIKEGRYTFPPKPGYIASEVPGIHVRHPITFTPLQTAFKEVASGLYTPLEAMKRLKVTEFGKYYKRWDIAKFRQFGTDPYYVGVLEVDRQVKIRNEHGLHEPMITHEEHERLKEVLLSKYRPRGASKQYNPEFPMNKLLVCEDCGCKLTGSRKHTGFRRENGKPRNTINYYWKYRCRGCGKEFHRLDVHTNITEHFDKFEYTGHHENDFIKALETVWRQKQQDKLGIIRGQKKRKEQLEERKSQLVILLSTLPDKYKQDTFLELDKTKEEINNLESKIAEEDKLDEDLMEFIDFALKYGEELKQDWWDLGYEDRVRCQQLLFPGGITIDSNKKVSTHNMNMIYRLAANKKDLSKVEKSLLEELPEIASGSNGLAS